MEPRNAGVTADPLFVGVTRPPIGVISLGDGVAPDAVHVALVDEGRRMTVVGDQEKAP